MEASTVTNFSTDGLPEGVFRVLWSGHFVFDGHESGSMLYRFPIVNIGDPKRSGKIHPAHAPWQYVSAPADSLPMWAPGRVFKNGISHVDYAYGVESFDIDTTREAGCLKNVVKGSLSKLLVGQDNQYHLPPEIADNTDCLIHINRDARRLIMPSLEWLRIACGISPVISSALLGDIWDESSVNKILRPIDEDATSDSGKKLICLRSNVPNKAADLAYQLTNVPIGKKAAKSLYNQRIHAQHKSPGAPMWLGWAPPVEKRNFRVDVAGVWLNQFTFLGLQIVGVDAFCTEDFDYYRENGKGAEEDVGETEKLDKPDKPTKHVFTPIPPNEDSPKQYVLNGVPSATLPPARLAAGTIKDLGMRRGRQCDRPTETEYEYLTHKGKEGSDNLASGRANYKKENEGNQPAQPETEMVKGIPESIMMTYKTVQELHENGQIKGWDYVPGPFGGVTFDSVNFVFMPANWDDKEYAWSNQVAYVKDEKRKALVLRLDSDGKPVYLVDPWPRTAESLPCVLARQTGGEDLPEEDFINTLLKEIVMNKGHALTESSLENTKVGSIKHLKESSSEGLLINRKTVQKAFDKLLA